MEGVLRATGPQRMQRMRERVPEKPSRERIGVPHQVVGGAFGDDAAALLSGAGTEIDHVRGAPDGVLVVLDHHQRVALRLSCSSVSSRILLSRGCRPMVGSSRM